MTRYQFSLHSCVHTHIVFFYRPMHWLLDFLNRDLNGRSREEENSSPARAHIKICKIVSFSVAFLDACNQVIISENTGKVSGNLFFPSPCSTHLWSLSCISNYFLLFVTAIACATKTSNVNCPSLRILHFFTIYVPRVIYHIRNIRPFEKYSRIIKKMFAQLTYDDKICFTVEVKFDRKKMSMNLFSLCASCFFLPGQIDGWSSRFFCDTKLIDNFCLQVEVVKSSQRVTVKQKKMRRRTSTIECSYLAKRNNTHAK